MSMTQSITQGLPETGLSTLWSRWARDAVQRQLQAYAQRRRQRATVMLLKSLSDRTLADIGIDRSEIQSVVHSRSHDRRRAYQSALE